MNADLVTLHHGEAHLYKTFEGQPAPAVVDRPAPPLDTSSKYQSQGYTSNQPDCGVLPSFMNVIPLRKIHARQLPT